jgi:Ser-tRNA(Ala) deacylase AlaX
MPTETLFRDDAYLNECEARVVTADAQVRALDHR